MLTRRKFITLSAVVAAGTMLPMPKGLESWSAEPPAPTAPPSDAILHLRGHKKSGCAFHPELVDWWAGGGAQLPDWC